MSRWQRCFLASAILSVTPGCCSLAQFFCGPDKSPWIAKSYASPEDALATFLEALRRDDSRQMYLSLSEEFKEREGLLGALEFELAWRKLTEAYGYLHLLSSAEITNSTARGVRFHSFDLVIAGQVYRISLHRQDYIKATYQVPGFGEPLEAGRYVRSIEDFVQISPPTDTGTAIDVKLDGMEIEELSPRDLLRVEVGRFWRIDAIQQLEIES